MSEQCQHVFVYARPLWGGAVIMPPTLGAAMRRMLLSLLVATLAMGPFVDVRDR